MARGLRQGSKEGGRWLTAERRQVGHGGQAPAVAHLGGFRAPPAPLLPLLPPAACTCTARRGGPRGASGAAATKAAGRTPRGRSKVADAIELQKHGRWVHASVRKQHQGKGALGHAWTLPVAPAPVGTTRAQGQPEGQLPHPPCNNWTPRRRTSPERAAERAARMVWDSCQSQSRLVAAWSSRSACSLPKSQHDHTERGEGGQRMPSSSVHSHDSLGAVCLF